MLGIADWCIIGVLASSCAISLLRGFIKEALSLLSWIAAFAIALIFTDAMDYLLIDVITLPAARYVAAFAALFVGSLILFALISKLIVTVIKNSPLSGIDRLMGVAFGFVRGILGLLVILIFVAPIFPVQEYSWWQESLLIPQLQLLEDWFRHSAEAVRQLFAESTI